MQKYYIAGFVPEKEGGYCVYFPDLPMVNAEGDTLEEATEMAADALKSALEYMSSRNDSIPEPSSLEATRAAVKREREESGLPYREEDAVFQLVRIPNVDTSTVRLNISLPKSVLTEIDEKAKHYGFTRSGFIARAAQTYRQDM